MRRNTLMVFDEVISGAGPWYSSTSYNGEIGAADMFVIQAVPTGVGGTSPTLTVDAEESPDGEHWIAMSGTPQINGDAISEDEALVGWDPNGFASRYVRLKITMGGTGPRCRLRLYASLRDRAAPGRAMPSMPRS